MTNRENNPNPPVPLTWTGKAEWGSEGRTHRTKATIHGDTWSFWILQPRKGEWRAQGVRESGSGFYSEGKTLAAMKAEVVDFVTRVATEMCETCRKISGHELNCPAYIELSAERSRQRGERIVLRDIGPSFRKVTQGLAELAVGAASSARSLRSLVWLSSRTCSCPTPVHRMSCGEGSTPKVVSL